MTRHSALRDMAEFTMFYFYFYFIKQAGDRFRTFYSLGQNSLVTKQKYFPGLWTLTPMQCLLKRS